MRVHARIEQCSVSYSHRSCCAVLSILSASSLHSSHKRRANNTAMNSKWWSLTGWLEEWKVHSRKTAKGLHFLE